MVYLVFSRSESHGYSARWRSEGQQRYSPFIHSGYLYSASSSPLLLRGAPDYQECPSHGGNEAEIFIIAILGGDNFLAILGGKKFFLEKLSDFLKGEMYNFM